GIDRVEAVLDSAHALSLQRRRNLAVRKVTPDEERERLLQAAEPPPDPYQRLHRRAEYVQPDLQKLPLSPEEDLLLFIRDNNPYLANWERDLLTIVDEES